MTFGKPSAWMYSPRHDDIVRQKSLQEESPRCHCDQVLFPVTIFMAQLCISPQIAFQETLQPGPSFGYDSNDPGPVN